MWMANFNPVCGHRGREMITPNEFRHFALSLPESEEKSHLERTSFRVRNKIFATLSEDETEAVLKLTSEEQTAQWIEANGYEMSGPPRELFYGSPHHGDLTAEVQILVRKV